MCKRCKILDAVFGLSDYVLLSVYWISFLIGFFSFGLFSTFSISFALSLKYDVYTVYYETTTANK